MASQSNASDGQEPNDSDDWTLVSPPHSASSSPSRAHSARPMPAIMEDSSAVSYSSSSSSSSGSGSSADELERETDNDQRPLASDAAERDGPSPPLDEDGLTEIDLNESLRKPKRKRRRNSSKQTLIYIRAVPTKKARQSEASQQTTTDSGHDQAISVRASSKFVNSELMKVEKIPTRDDGSTCSTLPAAGEEEPKAVAQSESPAEPVSTNDARQMEGAGKAAARSASSQTRSTFAYNGNMRIKLSAEKPVDEFKEFMQNMKNALAIILMPALVLMICVATYQQRKFFLLKDQLTGDIIDTDTSSHTFVELKLMAEEVAQCIKRENPHLMQSSKSNSEPGHSKEAPYIRHRPYVGAICYGNEDEWRKRFERLRRDYDFDYRKVLKQARKRLTNEMLEQYHPSIQFNLLTNQLEYLDYVSEERRKRDQEQTIKRLKMENGRLAKRLDEILRQPNNSINQKALSKLEAENSHLKSNVETLRGHLAEKAGTVYIRQSQELEKCKQDHNLYRHFHDNVAQDISKGFRLLKLNSIDVSTLSHVEGLGELRSQLGLTRSYLQRLTDEIGLLARRNEALETDDMGYRNALDLIGKSNPNGSSNGLVELYIDEPTSGSSEESLVRRINESLLPDERCLEDKSQVLSQKEQSNWLMRRAKLRERLRKDSDKMGSFCRHSDDKLVECRHSCHNCKADYLRPPKGFESRRAGRDDQPQQPQQQQQRKHSKKYESDKHFKDESSNFKNERHRQQQQLHEKKHAKGFLDRGAWILASAFASM